MTVPVAARWTEFKPTEEDLTKVLGSLEADVLDVLWELKKGHVKKIHQEVAKKRALKKRKIAITTVATVLDRLFEKGFVDRELKRKNGIRYEYSPSITETQLKKAVVRDVLNGLFETFGEAAIAHLVDRAGIEDEDQIEEFRKHLEKARRERVKP